MSKVIVKIGYGRNYVLDADVGVMVAKALADAEQYERIYIPTDERKGDADHAHYVWTPQNPESISMEFIGEDLLNMARLAGAPEKRR